MKDKKILHLPLKGVYFHQIKDGTKHFEYRLRTDYWRKRLVGREYDEVHIKLGYPKAGDMSKIIVLPYVGYEEQTLTHPHFGDKPVEVFAIKVKQANN